MLKVIESSIKAERPELSQREVEVLAERVFTGLVGAGWALPYYRTTKRSRKG